MDGYRIVKGRGSPRYTKNIGTDEKPVYRFIGVDKVPQEVRSKLESAHAASQLDTKKCLFCGGHATETRFVNQQTIALCDEHYYDRNVGQIVQRLKEVYRGEESSQESQSS